MTDSIEAQLEGQYKSLLATLQGEKRAQLVKSLEEPDEALRQVTVQQEDIMEEIEQDLQAAVADYEEAQRVLSELEQPGAKPTDEALEKARTAHRDASKVMETCMALRTERSASFAQAKDTAKQKRLAAMRDVVEQFSGPMPKVEDETSPKSVTGSTAPFEPIQEGHADLVIRLGRFDKVGIVVKPDGIIQTAPGGLFNSDYQVVGIDGKRFTPGLENTDGTHTIILRCRNADMLASLKRVPPKLLRGKALKLMQIKLAPGDKGFGIDLSEVNHVAGLVKGGKAEEADLRIGDVIVAADGVNIGMKRLVEVLRKGRPSYVFNVVRPAAPAPMDRADELLDTANGAVAPASAKPTVAAAPTSANGAAARPAAPPAKDAESAEDDLKRSLAESLGRMQQVAESLVGPTVRVVRCAPKDGTGITVEWAPRPGSPKVSHYHLQWKLVSDHEWSQTEASKKIAATVVTKGNLKPDGQYQFRVRACGKQSGEWGAWCSPTPPITPSSDVDEVEAALSTIAEEASDVGTSVTATEARKPSPPKDPKAQTWSDHPTTAPSSKDEPGQALAMDVVQGLLKDQRQALEAQSASELEGVRAELEAARAELEDWKAQFLEASGNSMQQVVDAKEETRKEVLAELDEEKKAVEAMKAEASQSVELIRAAQKAMQEAKEEAAHYKKRFDVAKAEAKAETDKEADMKVNVVMRNAALELRDKVKFVEQQTDATVKRAVDEAVRVAEAKAEVKRRDERRELEAAHEKQMQSMRDMVGAGAKHRISEIQAAQDERVDAAVRQALANAKDAAAKSELVAVQTAIAEAVEETETRMTSRQTVLEQQLVTQRKDYELRMSEMYTEDQVQALVQRAKAEAQAYQEKAIRQAKEQAEERAAMERQKALETVSETIRKSVQEREQELLANNGQGLQELAEKELKDASRMVLHAGQQAAQQWDTGNDEFEELALKKTQPNVATHSVEAEPPPPKNMAKPKAKLSASSLQSHDDDIDNHVGISKRSAPINGTDDNDDAESMVAPPKEYLQMKARHRAEEQALLARQSIDQYREEEEELERGETSGEARKEGRARRAAEKEALKERQIKEAMEAGQALAYEDQAHKAREDMLDADALHSPSDDDIRSRSAEHPELRKAFEKVNELESKLRSMQEGESNGAAKVLSVDRGDNMIARDNVQTILQRSGDKGISEVERESLQEVMELLQRHMQRGKKMQAMLEDIEPNDAAAEDTASCVQQDISRDEDQMGALALQLQDLIARDTKAKLNEDEKALLRQLTGELKSQQEQAEMREAQITWLQAEAKRARLTKVLEARAELERLHKDALEADRLALPTTPIAAAEDAFSIAVDWLPPVSGKATRYHLQWRSDDDGTWTSSSASEKLNVPCCTKGHLRTKLAYQFRVRAADKAGRWGPWSAPTEPTAPNVLLSSVPSRPQLKAKSKGRVEARWTPPEGPAAKSFELEWRTCDGQWGEPSSTMECDDNIVTTPSLVFGTYYTFRVRASIQRHRGLHWTDWSPPSAPVLVSAGKGAETKAASSASGKRDSLPRLPPSRPDDEATESVIEADVRNVLSGYHPTAQKAVEAKLAKVKEQRAQDEANLKTLEQRNRAISNKAREDQLNELVRVKRAALSRAVENGEAIGREGEASTTQATESWD